MAYLNNNADDAQKVNQWQTEKMFLQSKLAWNESLEQQDLPYKYGGW